MKTFTVVLGGAERRLRYTSPDAIALHKRFGRPLAQLIREDVLGVDADGNAARAFNPEAHVALLHLGLAHDIRRLDEAQVLAWLDELLAEGGDLETVVAEAAKAAYYSGIVYGRRVDIDEENARDKAAKAGKDPAAAMTAETAPPTVVAAE